MGWVAIPLAVLGLAALSGGNNTSYEYAGYQQCTYAPAPYSYASQPAAYAPAPGYGAPAYTPSAYGQQGHYQGAPAYQGDYTMQGGGAYGAYGASSGYAGASAGMSY